MFTQKDDEAQLEQAHPDLQAIIRKVAEKFDVFVVFVYRSRAQQASLYAQGRTRPGHIVTDKDGVTHLSKHNFSPSLAVDLAPAAVLATGKWVDTPETNALCKQMANCAKAAAAELGVLDYSWGGDWNSLKDLDHHQLDRIHPIA